MQGSVEQRVTEQHGYAWFLQVSPSHGPLQGSELSEAGLAYKATGSEI